MIQTNSTNRRLRTGFEGLRAVEKTGYSAVKPIVRVLNPERKIAPEIIYADPVVKPKIILNPQVPDIIQKKIVINQEVKAAQPIYNKLVSMQNTFSQLIEKSQGVVKISKTSLGKVSPVSPSFGTAEKASELIPKEVTLFDKIFIFINNLFKKGRGVPSPEKKEWENYVIQRK